MATEATPEILRKSGAGRKDQGGSGPAPDAPVDDIAEAFSPTISTDTFSVGDRTFQFRISNIKTQKVMAKSLDAFSALVDKISLSRLMESFSEFVDRPDASGVDGGDAKDPKGYVEIVDLFQELIREIIRDGGFSTIMQTMMDLYAGVVFAICNAQDRAVTREWVEENIGFADAGEIVFRQLEKDRVGGRVVDFLSGLTRMMIRNQENPAPRIT